MRHHASHISTRSFCFAGHLKIDYLISAQPHDRPWAAFLDMLCTSRCSGIDGTGTPITDLLQKIRVPKKFHWDWSWTARLAKLVNSNWTWLVLHLSSARPSITACFHGCVSRPDRNRKKWHLKTAAVKSLCRCWGSLVFLRPFIEVRHGQRCYWKNFSQLFTANGI